MKRLILGIYFLAFAFTVSSYVDFNTNDNNNNPSTESVKSDGGGIDKPSPN